MVNLEPLHLTQSTWNQEPWNLIQKDLVPKYLLTSFVSPSCPKPGTWDLGPGSRHLVPDTWRQAPGARYMGPKLAHLEQGAWHKARGSGNQVPVTRCLAPSNVQQRLKKINAIQKMLPLDWHQSFAMAASFLAEAASAPAARASSLAIRKPSPPRVAFCSTSEATSH